MDQMRREQAPPFALAQRSGIKPKGLLHRRAARLQQQNQ